MKAKGLVLVFCMFFIFQACNKKSSADFNSDFSLFKEYIVSFTGGIISSESDIRVVLAFDKKEWKVNQILDSDLFDISPSVDGKVVALSSNTIAFIPEEKLKAGTEYQVTLNLDKLITLPKEKEKELSKFNFTAKTIKQDFIINTADIQSYNKEYQYLNCVLKTADNIDVETAKKLILANQKGNNLKIKFEKTSGSAKEFNFKIDSIQRFSEPSSVEIAYDGDDFDIDQKGKIIYPVTSINEFKIIQVEVSKEDNQSISVNFSEPLEKGQDFKGLVSLQNANNLKFSTQGNVLKVYFSNEKQTSKPVITEVESVVSTVDTVGVAIDTSAVEVDSAAVVDVAAPVQEAEPVAEQILSGELLLEIFQGIESQYGQKLGHNFAQKISFDEIKPSIRFIKNGTILPSSNNLKLNFEAVNLSSVDVKVYKIYKNNILQFLQYNELNGTQNLKKVGQPVAKTTLNLKENTLLNLGKWNTFALDLSKIINPEPGAIYRVEMSYKKAYSLYKCEKSEEEESEEEEEINENDVNYSENSYDDYYYDNYEWRESQDPCSGSYFYNARIATNILATDLGVIAKRGGNKSYIFAVNNIVTTEPVSNARVDLYTFQQQKITTGTTSSEGIASFQLDKFAYFAIVTLGTQSTYVKLDDGTSLSVSNFDVAGETLQKGLKGFLYGERGVWRPGDNLYLSFILNDAANKLPNAHPIKFRLTDPNGKITYQTIQKINELNHYAFTVPTSADAPTGNWEAMVSVGGAKFYKSIKIETIKPNRLKIKNSFNKAILSSSYPNICNLEVTWLHGAIAKNLNVEMQAKFSQQTTTFKGYEKFTFDDAVRQFSTEEINVYSGKLDANGKASVNIKPELQGQAPGMLRASFMTKVFEEGGDFSADVISATYSPYKTYVGIKSPEPNKYGMLETRTMNRFDIVTVDENGRPKAVKDLEVKVYKIEWRWWWDAASDNLSNYNSSNATTSYKTYRINTDASGRGNLQFSLTDEEWGRYLIRVSDNTGGHATALTVNIDWPIWSGKTRNRDASTANMLVFSTDKKNYSVGEKAQVSFPSSEGGRAFISIENGSKVVQTLWAKTQKGETKVEIPITAAMAPNVYFNITLLQPHASTKNDSPIRMYGIVPIEVVDKNTILAPTLLMPDILKPEQTFTVKVGEKTGKEMTYTIAVVDEGLLDLTRFKTPNAWDSFYVREALGVKTWDIYDDVIGAYGGKINQIFSIGGDQDLGGGKAKKANRFKPVVLYFGPFKLEKGQTKSHQLKLPKYIGSVRTMVVAGDAATSAYGSVEKATPVRSPLMVLASLPRKISPSEKVTIPVTVFATEKNIKNVSIQIKTNNGLKVIGSTTQRLTFAQPDEKMAYFNLVVGSATGIGKVQIIATSGNQKSVYDVEIDMTNPNPVTNTFTDIILTPNSTKTISWKTFGVSGSNKAGLEVSSIPTINLNGRLQYLIQYPHGCVEQTTSSVFPQLFLNDVADLDAARKQLIQKNITAGITRLGSFQLSNGGFSYWQGNTIADDWGSSYAGHFLIEAEKKGYVLPINFKSKWISYQQKESKQWRFEPRYGNDLAQSYRLYTLALAGNADLSSMNRLRETKGISNESMLRLAAAYVLAGQKSAGLNLLLHSKIENESSDYNYYYYGSSERNRAMALETMLLLGQKQKAFVMASKLAKEMSNNQWMSTQTTAYCLYAMSKFATNNGPKGIDISFSKDGKSQAINTQKTIADRSLSVKTGANSITLKNNKKNTIYVRILNTGILPIGQEKTIQSNVSAAIVFKNRKGGILNVTKINQGTEFIAEVTIKNQKNEHVENVALSQILPSGFEIVNTRFTDYGDATNNIADYIDIRDDRTNFYFGMKAGETKVFRILLNASYLGNYYLPGLQCEAMYDNTFLARTKGFWVEVVK
ncbi:alpha-2-macroglobulin family protein [Flavobacterium sp. CF136]|uniref:alpha-2-macroglobulin family protein n=1 Tax=Flavobacterium sp. (strain CF136) TaxID=1144313 RepID=UPI0002715AC3|nr:MG2 domain-containing protein [Flavobacterium sp. CF136]EJL66181.1 large extracellular alpha-helical protein [Flavobacterium sp. CF136]